MTALVKCDGRITAVSSTSLDLDDSSFATCNGRLVSSGEPLQSGCIYEVHTRLLGGKGGFGSLLRAIGAQIEKTTNKEACRDLSGRRMRDVNTEKRLKEWASRAAERHADRKTKKREKLEKLTNSRHVFDDKGYLEDYERCIDNVHDAMDIGMKKRDLRPTPTPTSKTAYKRAKLDAWIGIELSGSESESDDDEITPEDLLALKEILPDVDIVALTSGILAKPNEIPPIPVATQLEHSVPETSTELNKSKDTIDIPEPAKQVEEEKPIIPIKVQKEFDAVDLAAFECESELEKLGLDHLKAELLRRKMKCGGTLVQRAQRLWTARGEAS